MHDKELSCEFLLDSSWQEYSGIMESMVISTRLLVFQNAILGVYEMVRVMLSFKKNPTVLFSQQEQLLSLCTHFLLMLSQPMESKFVCLSFFSQWNQVIITGIFIGNFFQLSHSLK